MKSFFKIFLATLAALLVFSLMLFFLFIGWVAGITSKGRPQVASRSVLVLDLSQSFHEQAVQSAVSIVSSNDEADVPGLYDVIRLLHKAATDPDISGLYIIANSNPNGFASGEELRAAISEFRKSKKFVIAYGDGISQKAFDVASVADRIYLNPAGSFEWTGLNVEFLFLKDALDRLNIQPQIFYAGKYKSATEPFRTDHMTPENRLQTTVWLNNIYRQLLQHISSARHIDTALLASYADSLLVRTPADALNLKFVDGLKYDDEVKEEIKKKLGLSTGDPANFISINRYAKAASFRETGNDAIALIYAEGDIVDGKSNQPGIIASETYVNMIRKARLDPSVKAIVFRVNSGGGSSLASENIWRELSVTRRSKPVVVSFGDVAASGGYYISCQADSIFADATTITGSIGVFGIIPNMESFFRNKLGVTFDGVKTSENAGVGIFHPLNETQKQALQNSIELTYRQFKQRVAEGRKRDTAYIETIAQGRVWTADDGIRLGLVDRMGGLQAAVACAARLVKTSSYHLREYPEPENFLERLLHSSGSLSTEMEKAMGPESYQVMQQAANLRRMTTGVQARLPISFIVQ